MSDFLSMGTSAVIGLTVIILSALVVFAPLLYIAVLRKHDDAHRRVLALLRAVKELVRRARERR